MQDEKIVELYWERNESALKETQDKYGKYLFKIAYNILSDNQDSEESVNDTYLAAWNSIPPQRPLTLSVYLAKLTRRIAIDIFRKRNRDKRIPSEYVVSMNELEGCLSVGNSTEQEIEVRHLAGVINDFLKELPETSRNLFIGRYYFSDSLKEVSRYCGVSESKAKTLLFRTRQKLKIHLEKEGYKL
ncbi:MAG: RNA polymerase sigma factor [Clostridia bacterium]|nr:RNA polymerase sigma factor [Clostridia bacterium]